MRIARIKIRVESQWRWERAKGGLAVSDIHPMFTELTITWVPSWFSGYIMA